jgi:ribose transport system ATP-binding protein
VTENITLGSLSAISRLGVVSRTSRRHLAEVAIRRFGIKTASPDQVVHSLSGGNQQKVVVARNLSTRVQTLVLDEPTRGIDVEAKIQMYQTVKDLADAGTTVLVSFSEFDEFAAVCDRVVVLRLGRVAGELTGPEISAEAIAALASEEVPLHTSTYTSMST